MQQERRRPLGMSSPGPGSHPPEHRARGTKQPVGQDAPHAPQPHPSRTAPAPQPPSFHLHRPAPDVSATQGP
eukprot:4002943-Prymnesium_polylepis.1